MDEYIYEEKVPKERIAVVIRRKGATKRMIQEEAGVKLMIDTKEGIVRIIGDDPLKLFNAREVIKAIARGFNPEIAKLLLRQDYTLEVINIKDYARTKNAEIRLKGRVIGEEGRSRANIERLTDCYLSVYGKTVSIIGEVEKVQVARRAVIGLLQGKTHRSVYSQLERKRREFKLAEKLGIDPKELRRR